MQFKPSLRVHPKNLFKFLTWKTNQNIVRDERWKCVLWKSAILFKLKILYYFCCLEDRLKSAWVQFLKQWYKQAFKKTSFHLSSFHALDTDKPFFLCKDGNWTWHKVKTTAVQQQTAECGELRPHSHIHQSYSSRFFPALYKCFRAHVPIWKVLLHAASKRFSSSTATSLQSLGAVGNLLHF